MIRHGETGLLADFFDADGLTAAALKVLDTPGEFDHLRRAGVELVRERYSLDVCLAQHKALFERAVARQLPG